jgi:7-cyano-7-deazaguanine synthase
MNAVVLLSGGLDSATIIAMARVKGRRIFALSFDYGQRHEIELEAARRIAAANAVAEHRIFRIDLRQFGGSALTAGFEVPKGRLEAGAPPEEIPVTYVPARNTIFLAIAAAYAEAFGAGEIWLGVNAVDFSGYPDCRPAFIEAFQNVILEGTRSGVEEGGPRIVAPLIDLSKSEIIDIGTRLGVDYSITRSCYDPDPAGRACGHCDACVIRRRGFEEARVSDPTIYSDPPANPRPAT